MVVLKIVIGLALLAVILFSLYTANLKCLKKFKIPLISKAKSGSLLISSVLLVVGQALYSQAKESGGDILNGIILMSIGVLIFLGIVYVIYKKTDLLYTLIGSVINLLLLLLITYIGLPLLIIYCACYVYLLLNAKPVYVVNK